MVYMFLATGFEEVEALAPLDLLRRAGVEIKTVGVGSKTIVGSHSIPVVTDMTDSEYCDESPEMIILPGGMPGTLNLDASETVHKAIKTAVANDAYVCAICAAPMILGKLGLLKGKNAVCYPGFEKDLEGATPANAQSDSRRSSPPENTLQKDALRVASIGHRDPSQRHTPVPSGDATTRRLPRLKFRWIDS